MGCSLRYFVFEHDGALRQVPRRVLEGLHQGRDRLPQYAGQTVRVAGVTIETEAGKPVRILRVAGSIWQFDDRGRFSREQRESSFEGLRLALEETHARPAASGAARVVDISRRLRRLRWEERWSWDPTPPEITRLVHAIWPETAGRPVARATFVRGVRRRRLPMSYKAKSITREIGTSLFDIGRRLEELGETDLKAFAGQARDKLKDYDVVERELWRGLAAAAEARLAVLKARRTNKGRWYASVEAITWEGPDRSTGRSDELEHVVCDSRSEAETAGRELLKKYADRFNYRTEIEVHLTPEIEWQSGEEEER